MDELATFEKVVIVIVNWERPGDTIRCIQSVKESDYSNSEIMLVDNGSKDESVNEIRSSYDQLHVIELPQNLGFTGGYNTGIKKALEIGAKFVFLLNNDTIVEKNTISLLVNNRWDISVPKIVFQDAPNLIWAAGARWRSFPPTIKMIGYKKPDGPKYNLAKELEYATGCALMIKKGVLDQVGGFDERYVNYLEDYDFTYRARKAGFTIGYVPGAKVLHKVSSSLGVSSPQRWHYLGRNTVLFFRHPDRFPSSLIWFVLGWNIIREIINGQARYIPDFWSGVKEGYRISKGAS